MAKANKKSRGNALTITRTFEAPRELVWKAWTQPGLVMRWWGPKYFTSPFCRIDLRVGGTYLYGMRSPEGRDYWSTGVYREIVEPERIVVTDSFADKDGNVVPASYYDMSADLPLEMLATVTFEDYDGKTKFTLQQIGFPAGEMFDNARTGWNESLDKLAETLKRLQAGTPMTKVDLIAEPGKPEVVVTKIFDAPRERVFKAYTDPMLIPKWWGLKSHTTLVDKMEVKPGGVWRFVERGQAGDEYAFHGVYHDIKSPERLVNTFEYEGTPGHVLLETVTFEEQDGKTKVTDKSVYQTLEDRDGMLKSGMEQGAAETLERLAALLAGTEG